MSHSDPTTSAAVIAAHDSEGQTLAAWTACGGVMAGSAVAGAALIIGSVALAVVAVLLVLACLAAGGLIGRATRLREAAAQNPTNGATEDSPAGATVG